ncbi:hypothetical protein JKP88DRAFT_349577 [Tribonema minus]|uniref:Uncharacterized protein n=1 Tax=Tribonema minus TaxID=303371 RepID=A0A835YVY6_9STRA|nr:hypothetical protein JKP88DRAFT_349577 [Tribonema minus]
MAAKASQAQLSVLHAKVLALRPVCQVVSALATSGSSCQLAKPTAGMRTTTGQARPQNFAWNVDHGNSSGCDEDNDGLESGYGSDVENQDWKQVWSERFKKGPLRTDYQAHFSWPPATAYSSPVKPPGAPPPPLPPTPPPKTAFAHARAGAAARSLDQHDASSIRGQRVRPQGSVADVPSSALRGATAGGGGSGGGAEEDGDVEEQRGEAGDAHLTPLPARAWGGAAGEGAAAAAAAPEQAVRQKGAGDPTARQDNVAYLLGEEGARPPPSPARSGRAEAAQPERDDVRQLLDDWSQRASPLHTGRREPLQRAARAKRHGTDGRPLHDGGPQRSAMYTAQGERACATSCPGGAHGEREEDSVGALLHARARLPPPPPAPSPTQLGAFAASVDRAQAAVKGRDLAVLCALPRPPAAVRALVHGVVSLLAPHVRMRWEELRTHVLRNGYNFARLLDGFNKDAPAVTPAALAFTTQRWAQPDFISGIATAARGLATWLQALHAYAAYKAGPTAALPLPPPMRAAPQPLTPAAAAAGNAAAARGVRPVMTADAARRLAQEAATRRQGAAAAAPSAVPAAGGPMAATPQHSVAGSSRMSAYGRGTPMGTPARPPLAPRSAAAAAAAPAAATPEQHASTPAAAPRSALRRPGTAPGRRAAAVRARIQAAASVAGEEFAESVCGAGSVVDPSVLSQSGWRGSHGGSGAFEALKLARRRNELARKNAARAAARAEDLRNPLLANVRYPVVRTRPQTEYMARYRWVDC